MAQRSTEIEFKGTLAFADVNAANKLITVVNDMLERSMEVFWKARGDENYAPTLSNELGEMHDLCWNFVQSAKTQKTQDRQKGIFEGMEQDVKDARRVLGEYKKGEDWTLAQVNDMVLVILCMSINLIQG